jgi:hypothetical protein
MIKPAELVKSLDIRGNMTIVHRSPTIVSDDDQEEIAYKCHKNMHLIKNGRYELYPGVLGIPE